MEIGQILDAAKKAQAIDTDMALAKSLGVGRAAVSAWRHGTRLPDPVACAALAGLSGMPLAKVLGVVGEARAISREEKSVWRRLAASAAVLLLTFSLFPAPQAQARVSDVTAGAKHAHTVDIMRSIRAGAALVWLYLKWRFSPRPAPSPAHLEAFTC